MSDMGGGKYVVMWEECGELDTMTDDMRRQCDVMDGPNGGGSGRCVLG